MKTLRISLLVLFTVLSVSIIAKPKIRIIATGGTIAGVAASASNSAYTAGQVGIATLIEAVPQIKDLADVSGEQLVVGVDRRLIGLGHLGAARVELHAPREIDLHVRAIVGIDACGSTDGCEQQDANISTHATDDSHVPLGHWRVPMKKMIAARQFASQCGDARCAAIAAAITSVAFACDDVTCVGRARARTCRRCRRARRVQCLRAR